MELSISGHGFSPPISKVRVFSLPISHLPPNLLSTSRFFPTLTPPIRSLPFPPSAAAAEKSPPSIEQPGGKMVVELVGAFNDLTVRMKSAISGSSSRLLFTTLKLSIPILQSLPFSPDGRAPLSRALSVAFILADLQMDVEVISAGILREVLQAGAITMYEVKNQIGTGTAHLLHENLRMRKVPSKVEVLDDESAAALRKFCLTYYEIRAVILELALKLDMMRNLDYLPKYNQQILALEVLKIYAPLAHAVGTGTLSLELEDLSFQYLFPYSYHYVDSWLRSHETGSSKPLIDTYKEELFQFLKDDPFLADMVDDISIKGRYKSRFSTMKKLLKDGRKPEEVNDILGLRIILNPRPGDGAKERGEKACYRTHELIQSLWKEIPHRAKDYIARPKPNGYRSLHMAVDVSDDDTTRPLMEIQIRTTEMDTMADGGTASHSLYKGGLTDPEEVYSMKIIVATFMDGVVGFRVTLDFLLANLILSLNLKISVLECCICSVLDPLGIFFQPLLCFQAKRLKAIMMAAVELAALRLGDLPSADHVRRIKADRRDRVFHLLDKNGDGRISIEELKEVMEDLGAEGEDAKELMQLVDANSDGSLSSEEFDWFQRQVDFVRNLEDRDDQYRNMLDEKLQMTNSSGLMQVNYEELSCGPAVR